MTTQPFLLSGHLSGIAAQAGLVIDGENVRSKNTGCFTLEDFGRLVDTLCTGTSAQPRPGLPLFAVSVAARKWEELQSRGARMQRIEFDGGQGGPGNIDPWGKVFWTSPSAPALSTGMEWRARKPGAEWCPFDLVKCLDALGYEGRFVTKDLTSPVFAEPEARYPPGVVRIDQRPSDLWPKEVKDALQLAAQALSQVGAVKADGSRDLHHQAVRAVDAILADYGR